MDDSSRFRGQARMCRDIAGDAENDKDWQRWLLELAQELDEEADKIEAEEFQGLWH